MLLFELLLAHGFILMNNDLENKVKILPYFAV